MPDIIVTMNGSPVGRLSLTQELNVQTMHHPDCDCGGKR